MSAIALTSAEQEAIDFYASKGPFLLGSQFMAAVFDALFAGVVICQFAYWGFQAKHDTKLVRCLVIVGASAAIFTTGFTWANYLLAFVYDFGKFARFASWSMLGWYSILDMFTVVPVQIFFAERAVRINGNSKTILFICTFLILSTAGAAIAVTVVTRGQTMEDPTLALRVTTLLWPTICTTTHVFLTTTIVTGLFRTRTSSSNTNRLVNRVIAISLESQLPGTIFAVSIMTTLASNPSSPIVPFIIIVHPKVFMVGCLAMVNLRHSWRISGKITGSYQSAGTESGSRGSSAASAPGLSSGSSQDNTSEEGPSTPKIGLVRGLSQRSEVVDDLEYGLQLEEFVPHHDLKK